MKKLSLVVAICILTAAVPASARVGCNDQSCSNYSKGAWLDAIDQWSWGDLIWIFRN